MSRRVVAIHQPNFFPWLGFFDKIATSDVFVLLDHVQFPTAGGNYVNRVSMHVSGEPRWLTMPVVRRFEGTRRIDEMRIDDSTPWRRKCLNLLRANYAKAGCFDDVFPIVEPLVTFATDRVGDYNVNAITSICECLGIPATRLVRSSTLDAEGQKNQLLANLVRQVGGTTYLAGGGSGGYQDDATFGHHGISVEYQHFTHPVYAQRGHDFVPGLSILDALFHCGFEATASLLRA